MDDPSLARTLAARLEQMPDLACTIVERPNTTIQPVRSPSSGAMAALAALRALGSELGKRVDVHHTLGEGGMGIVHLGTQSTLGRHVAVKTLRDEFCGDEASLRILREAWVTGALEHPNIVPVHDVGIDARGAPVIVMKRIEGRPWADLMHDSALIAKLFGAVDPLEWNLRTFMSVCNAVHFAHSRDVLHRDIKPDNVMIGEFGEVYVLDWGIAVSLADDPSRRLPSRGQATEIAGTPSYMAPEMLMADPALLSPRTDVYLLGAVLYEIFAGRPPHEAATLQAMLSEILLSSPSFPSTFPEEARGICEKALTREATGRYESAMELRVAVEEYLRHRGSRRLARDAEQSLARLEELLREPAAGEHRDLRIANLLGECRFGYHAALSAWPDNRQAREGLDRALLLVVDCDLAAGDAHSAATLLRDVSSPPAEVVARVESAMKAQALEDERLHKLEKDHDPRVGTRTRTLLSFGFGLAWACTTMAAGMYTSNAQHVSYFGVTIAPGIAFLFLALAAHVWARQTLSKTLLNRRIGLTLVGYLVAQLVLGVGAWIAHVPWQLVHLLFLFAWGLVYVLLTIWAAMWFWMPAAVCLVSFLLACARPSLTYLLGTACNLVFTIVVVRYWFPEGDLARIRERKADLHSRARRWFHGKDATDEAAS